MAVRRKKKAVKESEPKGMLQIHMPKILAGLLATGAIGGTGVSYNRSGHADERAAVLETKVARQQEDTQDLSKKVDRMDRRTIRMEDSIKSIGEKLGVPRNYGPEEK